jgi:hypothetical protein
MESRLASTLLALELPMDGEGAFCRPYTPRLTG